MGGGPCHAGATPATGGRRQCRAIAFDPLRPSLRRTKPSRRPKLDHRGRKPSLRPRLRATPFRVFLFYLYLTFLAVRPDGASWLGRRTRFILRMQLWPHASRADGLFVVRHKWPKYVQFPSLALSRP